MKRRNYCDIPQDVLERLLQLPEGVRLVRMSVIHDSKKGGAPPLRIIVEHDADDGGDPDTELTGISPTYKHGDGFQFRAWWYGSRPPLADYFDEHGQDWGSA